MNNSNFELNEGAKLNLKRLLSPIDALVRRFAGAYTEDIRALLANGEIKARVVLVVICAMSVAVMRSARAKWDDRFIQGGVSVLATASRTSVARGAAGGAGLGAIAGILLGGGGVGIVALGGAIGIPLIALLALIGAAIGAGSGPQLQQLANQWGAAAQRKRSVEKIAINARRDEYLSNELAKKARRIEIVEGARHLELLDAAIAEAKLSICIRSAFLSTGVVREPRERALLRALSRGVDVLIEFGYSFGKNSRGNPDQMVALERLVNLERLAATQRYPGRLRIARTYTHIKELAVDDEYVVIGSNNWLSNLKFSNKEKSYLLYDKEMAIQCRIDTEEALNGQKS